tara:strand:- start:586 stop:1899 length:1314 start_codon:yes stop_codon:yes gene_type:complete
MTMVSSDIEDDGANYASLSMESGGQLKFINMTSSSLVTNYQSNPKFLDTTAWYHIVLRVDTTQSTASDRIRLYVNGEQVTNWAYSTTPNQDTDTGLFKSGTATLVGIRHPSSSPNYFEGEIAHLHIVDGTSYGPDTFGETDSTTGVWKPKTSPSVTYGTNGAFLKFENSGALGTDSSGNTNTFTVSGDLKQMLSTPSNKFARLNPRGTNRSYDTPVYQPNGGRSFLGTTGTTRVCMTDMCFAGGKWYWEAKIVKNNASSTLGVFLTDSTSAKRIEQFAADLALTAVSNGGNGAISFLCNSSSLIQQGNSTTSYGTGISDDDIIMFAFDADNGKVWTGRNGTWFNAPGTSNAGDPAAGTNDSGKTLTNTDRELMAFYVAGQNSDSTNRLVHTNFGDGYFGTTAVASANADGAGMGAFEYAVPSGFYAVCSKNIQDYGG